MVISEKAGGQGEKGESNHEDCIIKSILKGKVWGERDFLRNWFTKVLNWRQAKIQPV